MISHIVRIDQNIIKINYYTNIEKVGKDIIYKTLEDSRSIGKIKRYNGSFEEFVVGVESSLSFIAFVIVCLNPYILV